MRNKLYLQLVLLVGIVQVGMAQEKTITGVVTDADDGSPLPGVSVVIKGTHLGTATDAMGKYSIRIDGKAVLVFTFIGMQTQEIPVNNRSVVNVNMRLASIGIDEVVVTGYGTTTKGRLPVRLRFWELTIFQKKPMQTL